MLDINNNPWMGLASYDVGDSDLFFGRDQELEKTNEIIQNNLSTVIYGESGVGKTSLIRAGLFPRLIQNNYLPVWIRLEHDSDGDYCSQIEHAILEEVDKNGCEIEFPHNLDQNLLKPSERLWILLYSSIIWNRDNKKIYPVIFFDQFEEIFTLTSSSGIVKSFFKDIADFSQQVPNSALIDFFEKYDCKLVPEGIPQIHFVYSLREDFLGAMEDAASECLFLFKNKIRITKLNGEQALDAIVKPYPGLIDYPLEYNILKVLSGQEDLPADLTRIEIEPTILSLYCSELYVKACGMSLSSLTSDLVLSAGTDVIYEYYIKSLSDLHPESINYIEKELLTKNGFRKQLLADDVDNSTLPQAVIDRLINKRIIRTNKREKVLSYEFTHDVLCASAKRHRDETNNTGVIRNKIFQGLFWSYDLFLNTSIISLAFASQTFTHSLIQKPIELIISICSLIVSLLMRAVNYASKGRVKWASAINLALSILLISELSQHHYESVFIKWQIIILAIIHVFISTFIKQKKCTFLTAVQNLDKPIYIIPFKVFLLYLVFLFCNQAAGQLNTTYMRWICIIGEWIFYIIGASFLLQRTVKTLNGFMGFMLIGVTEMIATSMLVEDHLISCVIAFTILSAIFWKPSFLGLIIKPSIIFPLSKINKMTGIPFYYLYSLLVYIVLFAPLLIINQTYRNLNGDSAVIIVPEGKEAYGEHYIMQINSTDERKENILIKRAGKLYQVDKNKPLTVFAVNSTKIVLPIEYAEIDKIITHLPAKINDDGTVRLSDYLVRVKQEDTDTSFTTVHLSDYIHSSNCTLAAKMRSELETYYHSSSSARRRLYIHIQEHDSDNEDKDSFVQRIKEKVFGEKDKDNIYDLKWLVLANRMKELLVLEESRITGYNNVNDLCEIFRKGLKTDNLYLSPRFMSAIQFLNALGEDPSAFTPEEIMLKCHNLGLETAIKENIDILEGDPDFEIYVSHYSQPETEETETDDFSAEELL